MAVGQEVSATVISVDKEKKKVSLSLKEVRHPTLPSPPGPPRLLCLAARRAPVVCPRYRERAPPAQPGAAAEERAPRPPRAERTGESADSGDRMERPRQATRPRREEGGERREKREVNITVKRDDVRRPRAPRPRARPRGSPPGAEGSAES